ncbi:MAG: type II toxin-antitoxin system RelE/ParE family toxin [Chloroflexota bacterium]|nr:type II toxin-antitoxin system RelE/ParE family toxin [Chloroflexota bacterium]
MSYKLDYTDRCKETLNELDKPEVVRLLKKLEWVAQNAERLQHVRLKNPPLGLEKLCKYRVGPYRVLYWMDHDAQKITVYDVIWRKGRYRELYR